MPTTVKLIWVTPNAEDLLIYIARVSNPIASPDEPNYRLLRRFIERKEWSPLEMVHACVEIYTTRDMAHQIIRHRSFSYQEFSQRYADPSSLPMAEPREARLRDHKNRQNSLGTEDPELKQWWHDEQQRHANASRALYAEAARRGLAPEVSRVVLPEGLTTSRLYMVGSARSWVHYLQLRTGPETQKEHRAVADQIEALLRPHFPNLFEALWVAEFGEPDQEREQPR